MAEPSMTKAQVCLFGSSPRYRRPALCRVSSGLPSVFFRALGKELLCRVRKKTLGKEALCRVFFLTLGKKASLPTAKSFFAECFFRHLAKKLFAECFFTLGKEKFKAHFEAVN